MPKKKISKEVKEARALLAQFQREQRLKETRMESFERELTNTERSYKNLKSSWRKIMLDIKLPEVKMTAEATYNRFVATVDSKDYLIKNVLDALEEDEQQYSTTQCAHSVFMDVIINSSLDMVRNLQQWFYESIRTLHKEGQFANQNVNHRHQKNVEYVRTTHFIADTKDEKYNVLVQGQRQTKRQGEQNRQFERIQLLHGVLENQTDGVWRAMNSTMKSYYTTTGDFYTLYKQYKERDLKCSKEILYDTEKANKLNKTISALQETLKYMNENAKNVIENLKEERGFFIDKYSKLRADLDKNANLDALQMYTLVEETNCTIKLLQALLKKAGYIMSLSGICTEMETKGEKTRYIGTCASLANLEQPRAHTPCNEQNGMTEEMNSLEDNMEVFWRRVVQAELVCKQLIIERRQLLEYNKKLKAKLSEYMYNVKESRRLPPIHVAPNVGLGVKERLCHQRFF